MVLGNLLRFYGRFTFTSLAFFGIRWDDIETLSLERRRTSEEYNTHRANGVQLQSQWFGGFFFTIVSYSARLSRLSVGARACDIFDEFHCSTRTTVGVRCEAKTQREAPLTVTVCSEQQEYNKTAFAWLGKREWEPTVEKQHFRNIIHRKQ